MGALTVIGVDIGQKVDPTAICVAELEHRTIQIAGKERTESHYIIRFLQRLKLGTPYPKVAERVGEVCTKVHERTGRRPTVYVDATGVGQPVVDLLKGEAPSVLIWSTFFTYGDRRTETREERRVSLGKAFLVSRLQALLQCDRLHLPQNRESKALADELLNYEIRVDENANDRYGAFKVGTHDDLVTALGLAVQAEPVVSVYPRPSDYV